MRAPVCPVTSAGAALALGAWLCVSCRGGGPAEAPPTPPGEDRKAASKVEMIDISDEFRENLLATGGPGTGLDFLLMALMESAVDLEHALAKDPRYLYVPEEFRGLPEWPRTFPAPRPRYAAGRIAHHCEENVEEVMRLMDLTAPTKAMTRFDSLGNQCAPRPIELGDQIAVIVARYAGVAFEDVDPRAGIRRWYTDVTGKDDYWADLAELKGSSGDEKLRRLERFLEEHPRSFYDISPVYESCIYPETRAEMLPLLERMLTSPEDRKTYRFILGRAAKSDFAVVKEAALALPER